MFKVVRKSDAFIRQILENKVAINYITKETNQNVSFAVTEATDYIEEEEAKYDRIYYVLEGELTLVFDEEKIFLKREDACLVSKGSKYSVKGTFKVVVVNQPAFGS